jgi:hypothetical protein
VFTHAAYVGFYQHRYCALALLSQRTYTDFVWYYIKVITLNHSVLHVRLGPLLVLSRIKSSLIKFFANDQGVKIIGDARQWLCLVSYSIQFTRNRPLPVFKSFVCGQLTRKFHAVGTIMTRGNIQVMTVGIE